MINNNIAVNKNNEEMFCPTKLFCVLWIITALIMFVVGIGILFELLSGSVAFDSEVILLMVILAVVFLPTPIFIAQADIVYINRFGGYFRIKNKIILFSEISSIKYNYGFIKPYKYSIFSTVFYFVLKSGERIRFFAYFRGHEILVIKALKDCNFLVKTCTFKDL